VGRSNHWRANRTEALRHYIPSGVGNDLLWWIFPKQKDVRIVDTLRHTEVDEWPFKYERSKTPPEAWSKTLLSGTVVAVGSEGCNGGSGFRGGGEGLR
jgi:hypothetical protein